MTSDNPTLAKLSKALERIAEIIGTAEPLGISLSTVAKRELTVQLIYSDFISIFAGRVVEREFHDTHEYLNIEDSGVHFTACRRAVTAVTAETVLCPCPEPESVTT